MNRIIDKDCKRDIKERLFSFLLILFPLGLSLPLPQNIKSFFLIIFVIILILNFKSISISWKEIFKDKILLVLLVLFLLDPILSLFRGNGFYIREVRYSLVFIPLVFSSSREFLKKNYTLIFKFFVIGVLVYIFLAVCFVIYFYTNSTIHEFSFNYYLKYVTYKYLPYAIHHTYLGIYFCFALSILLFTKIFSYRLKFIFVIVIYSVSFILTSKLSVLILTLILIIEYGYRRKVKLSLFKAVLLIIIPIFILSLTFLLTDIFRTTFNSFSLRLQIFNCSLKGIYNNIAIGVGNYSIKPFMNNCNPSVGFMDTHNVFFQEFLSNGILGFMGILFFLFHCLKFFITQKNIIGVILIVLFILFGLIEHLLNLQDGVIFFIPFILLIYQKDKIN